MITPMTKTLATFGICSLVLACTKAEQERRDDAAEERADERQPTVQRSQAEAQRSEPEEAVNEKPTNEPSTNEATATKGLAPEVVAKITAARCAREQKCGNIGAGKDYASAAACETEIGKEWREELNAYECPGGIVTKEFEECLAEIRTEDCASPFDTLERVVACRSSDMCKAVD